MQIKTHIVHFFEHLYYRPEWYHWIVALALLPLSLLYGSIMWIRRRIAVRKDYDIPIISVGNLLVGGSGKTPMTIALAKRFDKPAVVLRGYGRKSRGMVVVSQWGEIKTDVETSGDEAMLLALSLPNATVIVSEDRKKAIEESKSLGAEIVFLDDGFSKVDIEKFEILLFPRSVPNILPFPSGPFREFPFEKRSADLLLTEGKDFERIVTCKGCDEPMLLVTAIANPARLEPFLPRELVKERLILPDHAWFDKGAIEKKMAKAGVRKILTTEKDAVKLERFGFPMAILKLELKLEPAIAERVADFMQNYRNIR